MIRKSAALAAALALSLTATAQAAPRQACITSAEMHGMVAYFLPVVLDNVTSNCSAFAPASSYLRSGLPGLQVQLREGREANWPLAKSAFFKMGGQKEARTMASLSDDALRPLVDDILGSKFTIRVNAGTCAEIDTIAEAMSPLNGPQTVHLVATILSVAARKDNKIPSCPRGI